MDKYDKPDTLNLRVINDGLCPPIFHPEIRDTQNKRKSPHDRKERIYICQRGYGKGGK